jgi:pimeloyl-ACP methyl ester carboxylesterase
LVAAAERWLTVHTEKERNVEVLVEGPDAGPVLIFHDGTPTAAVPFPPLSAPATDRGLRTVTFSRPGYATSTPQPGRSVASVVADTVAILDALKAERFLTIGWSGGGPHALACAALLPNRCTAAATLASVAPYGVAGLDWLAGMGPENIEEFGAAIDGEERLNPYLEREAAVLHTVTGSDVAAALGGLVSEVDKRALTGDYAEIMAHSFRRAVSTGIAGWRDDDLAFTRPWGFELSTIRVPVAIWQGDEDRMVPFAHGKWLAANIPGARSQLLTGDGHLSLVTHLERVLDELLVMASLPHW